MENNKKEPEVYPDGFRELAASVIASEEQVPFAVILLCNAEQAVKEPAKERLGILKRLRMRVGKWWSGSKEQTIVEHN